MPKDRPPAFSQSVTSTNQVSGFTYDVAGNLAGIPGGGSYTYDAENHLTSAAGVAYTYDGDGERVEKSNGEIYWYTSGGEVLDETDLSGNLTSEYIFFGGARIARRDGSGNVFYYLTDHLGSSREIVEAGQTTACYDADFYPFGGERAYTNTCQQNYKFTGKERDPESGLDDFEARYYGSSIARFTSPDDPFVGWQLNDPQSLNLYAYVQDNPINDVDPTGHCLIVNGGSVMQCGFSELEAAMNTMTIEGWNYTGIGVPAPDTTGIAATNNIQAAEQQHVGNVAATIGAMEVQKQLQKMSLSSKGLDFIKRHEGFSSKTYKDSAGNDTIGYGHLINKKTENFDKGITEKDAAALLQQDANTAVGAVNSDLKVEVSQTQFDALVDFTYNEGAGAFGKSTLLSNINGGKDVTENNFTDWSRAGKDPGALTTRRTDEYNLYSKGEYGGP